MDKSKQTILTWHEPKIKKTDRQALHKHKSFVLWFTGLSGSGKSTLANYVEECLYNNGIGTYLLDGDNIRMGLNKDLDFSPEDRLENIRRIGEVSKLFVDAGIVVLTAFISPYIEDRRLVRNLLAEEEFIEIYIKCSLETCEKRDPKGIYKKARNGDIPNFTGISSPYEPPSHPEIIIDTEKLSIEEGFQKIIDYLYENAYIGK